ncbi:MAG: putative sugar O-methyltransferase [Hyphomicrobiales bacterium]
MNILDRFGHSYTLFGGVSLGIDGYTHWNQQPGYAAYSYYDKLVRLAEAVGTLGVESPEHGPNGNWGRNQNIAADDLCAQLEQDIGFKLGIEQNGLPVFGLLVGSGLLHYRHLNAAYVAFRLKQILRACSHNSRPKSVIAEYGGGLGLVAYYMSFSDIGSYRLFDLPVTNAISAWFLLNCAHPIKVSLYGETASDADGTVMIHPSWRCPDLADASMDISLNIDSMPEMSAGIVQAFKKEIRRSTSHYFLSINQEHMLPFAEAGGSHNRVFDIFGKGAYFELLSRHPYWMRPGYVKELWKPAP